MKPVKVIYAEDHLKFRKAVAEQLLEHNIQVIAEVSNGKELLESMNLNPNVILLDLQMPEFNGSKAFDELMRKWPNSKVIIVSMHSEQMLIDNYRERGAYAYISKDEFAGDIMLLVNAIKKVNKGEKLFNNSNVEHIFSEKQKEIIPLILSGLTNKEIAEKLGVHERSVEKQREKIYEKSGSKKSAGFFEYAFTRGLQFFRGNK